MAVDMRELYLRNSAPVAYLDESYELHDRETFYILSCALVYPDDIADTRQSLTEFYGGNAMHASEMWSNREVASLRAGIKLATTQHDGADLVVFAPVAHEDSDFGADARAACLQWIAPMLQREEGTRLFVFDKLDTPTADQRDQNTFSDLRRAGRLERSTTAVHVRPSEEPLLGLPDLLAWSFRQEHTQRSTAWFDPFRAHTRIHYLP